MRFVTLVVGVSIASAMIPVGVNALTETTNQTGDNSTIGTTSQEVKEKELYVLLPQDKEVTKTAFADWVIKKETDRKTVNQATEPVSPEPTSHIVRSGESLEKIANKYNVKWRRIWDKNKNLDHPDEIHPGEKVIIPADDEKLESRKLPEPPKPAATQANRRTNPSTPAARPSQRPANTPTMARGSSSGNLYTPGYCTWYVKNKRPDLPNNLGNANTWVARAASQGMSTGSTPRAGAVGQRGMHVVYVERVNGDGTVTISEMNHKGLYVVTTRTLPANYFSYIY